jgi:very-short-patch-repair endonuclease
MTQGPKRIRLARVLRQRNVPAEALLWKALRNRVLGGFKFRRQHPIGSYIVDFACVECAIVVELDGTTHLHPPRTDVKRTTCLEAEGWQVLRFWNIQVFEDLEAVKEAIYQARVQRRPGA